MKIWIGIIVCLLLVWKCCLAEPQTDWVGRKVDASPIQTTDGLPGASWNKGHYAFMAKANYEIKAVVLSKHHYWGPGFGNDLSPYDLALGWGPMSVAQTIRDLHITQDHRWYSYHWDDQAPLPPQDIISHSSNTHIIPGNDGILKRLESVKKYDVVTLRGWLVDISGPNGWYWHSSMSREDTGDGSCEVLYLTGIEVQ